MMLAVAIVCNGKKKHVVFLSLKKDFLWERGASIWTLLQNMSLK